MARRRDRATGRRLMGDAQAGQGIRADVEDYLGKVKITLTSGGHSMPIVLEPQVAFQLGENRARAAHKAHTGTEVPAMADELYLRDLIKRRTTWEYRDMLVRKFEL